MNNILVVDDEMPIREWIGMCARNNENTKEVITAKNGAEAIEIVKNNIFDIVFTDITMPKIDGLTLLEFIKKHSPKTVVIIMSVHKEFEYARNAIKAGAADYIVKNEIDQEIINTILNKYTKENNIIINDKNSNIDLILASNYIKEILSNPNVQSSKSSLQTHKIMLEADGNWGFFVVALPNSLNGFENTCALRNCELKNKYYISYGDDNLLFFSNISANENDILNNLHVELKQKCDKNIGCSKLYNDITKFKNAVIEAVLNRSADFYHGEISNDDTHNIGINSHYLETKYKKEVVELAFEINKISCIDPFAKQKVVNSMTMLIDYLKLTMISDILFVRVLLQDIVQNLCEHFNNLQLCENINTKIETEYNFVNMQKYLFEFINELVSDCTYSDNIKSTLKYIDENYKQNISMSDAAKRLFLNEEYFSRLFKSEVGLTFTNYLNNLRMTKAKELILESNIKINAVGEMVGIKNPKYFSMLFKKHHNITPSKLREEMSK